MPRKDKQADYQYKKKHKKEHYDRKEVLLPKGMDEHLKKFVLGKKSFSLYANELINEDLEKRKLPFKADELSE